MSLDLATIGIAVETSGLEKGTRALKDTEQAANKTADAADKASGRLSAFDRVVKAAADQMATLNGSMGGNQRATDALTQAVLSLNLRFTGLDASIGNLSGRLDGYSGNAGKAAGATEKVGSSANSAGAGLAGLAKSLAATAAATLSLGKAIEMADAWTNMNNRIKLVTQGQAEFAQAQANILSIANATRQPLAETAELYQRVAMNQKQLGMTGNEMAGVIKTISQTMVISGASAQGSSAALVQLGQAFASGTLRGEELNSVLEQAPALAQTIATGMGKTVGELRALGEAGKLTAEAVVASLQKQAGAVTDQFGKMAPTVSQAMTVAGNKLTEFIGKLDASSGASAALAGAIVGISDNMGALLTGAVTAAGGLTAAIGLATGAATAFMVAIGPLGWAVLAVGAVATAWQLMGNKAQTAGVQTDDAASKARAAGDKLVSGLGAALSDINKRYEDLIAKQNQALGIAPSVAQKIANDLKPQDAEMTGLGKRISQANNGEGDFAGMSQDARRAATTAMLDKMKVFASQRAATDKLLAESNGKAVDEYIRNADRMTDAGRKELKQQKAGMEYAEAFRRANGDIAKELAVRKSYERELANIGEEFAKKDSKGAGTAVRAANKELDSQAKLLSELSGLTGTFSKDWARLNTQYAAGKLSVEQLTQAQAGLLAKQPAMKAAAVERAKAEKEFGDAAMREHNAELKRVESIEKTLSGMTDQNQKLKEEIEMLGLSEQAQLAITQARLSSAVAIKEEQVARLQNSEFLSREQIALEEEIRLLKERMGLLGQKSQRNVAVEQAKEAASEWKKFSNDIERGLTDSLMRAFEGGKGFAQAMRDTITGMFKTMVLRPVISAVMSPVSSAIGSVLGMPGASNVAAGTDLFGMASNASSLYSSASSLVSMGSQVFAGTMSVANALGTVAANATGTGISGLLAANGAYGTAVAGSATALAGTATAAMAAIPWGWAALGAAAIGSLFGGKKDSRFGSQYQYTPGSGSAVVGGPNAGVDFGGMSAASNAAAAGIDDLLTKLGSLSRVGSLSSGFESSEKGKGFSYAGGVLSTGQVFGQGANGRGYENNRGSMTVEQAHASYIQELKQSTLQALQAATDIPKSVEDLLKGVNIDGLTNAALDQLMATVGAQVTQLANFKAALDLLPFTQLQGMSIKALDALSALTGGLDALGTKLGSYYENFYSAEEKRANMVRNITKTLKDAGGAWTEADVASASREAFRKLVESTDTGSPLYAALINVSDAFASITPAIESAADMAKAAIEAALEQVKVARSNLIDAYKAEATAMQSTVDKFRNFATDLRSFRDGLTLGALSPLTPAQRYAQASGQFNNTVAATKSGSEAERIAAIGNLQGASTALLEASKVYNSSSGAYVMDFNRVQSALADAAISALATADVAQLQLDAAKSQLTALGEIDKSVISVSSAIEALAAAQMAAVTAGALPAFENGGTHGSARAMAAERGPELAYMPPVSIYTATDTGRVMGGQSASNDALLAEVKAMREESKQLREEIKQLRQQQSEETGALIQSHYDANAKNAEFITTHQSKKSWSTEPALS